ncbi:hypothetical protein A5740_10815 [Mycobacterium sp. GA-1841]|uniref:hypothetical protein n=1 Tax=Mycobacterium sp. GA-1841 TaxID=1834154 RepID=UPI00096C4992|nr:hypothetical protein [Mycobacterium sp. GA-1841]OMC34120.1 hypothetical protein A5740_10815 [Mycobacterium sp. GA-1841]
MVDHTVDDFGAHAVDTGEEAVAGNAAIATSSMMSTQAEAAICVLFGHDRDRWAAEQLSRSELTAT